MTSQVSNRFIAVLVIAALMVSLLSTAGIILQYYQPPVTGAQTLYDTATASYQITEVVEINWSQATLDWGPGNVDTGAPAADLNSNDTDCTGTVLNGTWTCALDDLVLDNIGTQTINITVSSDQDNETLIGGTGPKFQWMWWEEGNACFGDLNDNYTSFGEITPEVNTSICSGLNFSNANNQLYMDILITVPDDATQVGGANTATFVASATALG